MTNLHVEQNLPFFLIFHFVSTIDLIPYYLRVILKIYIRLVFWNLFWNLINCKVHNEIGLISTLNFYVIIYFHYFYVYYNYLNYLTRHFRIYNSLALQINYEFEIQYLIHHHVSNIVYYLFYQLNCYVLICVLCLIFLKITNFLVLLYSLFDYVFLKWNHFVSLYNHNLFGFISILFSDNLFYFYSL